MHCIMIIKPFNELRSTNMNKNKFMADVEQCLGGMNRY